jgi:hypothetical protein
MQHGDAEPCRHVAGQWAEAGLIRTRFTPMAAAAHDHPVPGSIYTSLAEVCAMCTCMYQPARSDLPADTTNAQWTTSIGNLAGAECWVQNLNSTHIPASYAPHKEPGPPIGAGGVGVARPLQALAAVAKKQQKEQKSHTTSTGTRAARDWAAMAPPPAIMLA